MTTMTKRAPLNEQTAAAGDGFLAYQQVWSGLGMFDRAELNLSNVVASRQRGYCHFQVGKAGRRWTVKILVSLMADDTYEVELVRIERRGEFAVESLGWLDGVYCDSLGAATLGLVRTWKAGR